MTQTFDDILDLVRDGKPEPAESLRQRLERMHEALRTGIPDADRIRVRLAELLAFLVHGDEERERALRLSREYLLVENEWEMDWSYLPDPIEDALFALASEFEDDGRLEQMLRRLAAAGNPASDASAKR